MAKELYPFIAIRTVGRCTEGGRSNFSLGFSGKVIAQSKTPLSEFVRALVRSTAGVVEYDDPAAMNRDINSAIRYLEGLKKEPERERKAMHI